MEKPHKRLEVRRKSVDFVTEIYKVTKEFPADERYGLVSQMRRAAVSIPSNLAEGAAKGTNEYIQFIRIAIDSASELDTQLEICYRLGYLSDDLYQSFDKQLTQIDQVLVGLRQSLLKK